MDQSSKIHFISLTIGQSHSRNEITGFLFGFFGGEGRGWGGRRAGHGLLVLVEKQIGTGRPPGRSCFFQLQKYGPACCQIIYFREIALFYYRRWQAMI